MDITEFASVPAITFVAFVVATLVKTLLSTEAAKRLIPVLCALVGCALGLLCYFTLPDFIAAQNYLTAAIIGMVSGLSATGVHQAYKQLHQGTGQQQLLQTDPETEFTEYDKEDPDA